MNTTKKKFVEIERGCFLSYVNPLLAFFLHFLYLVPSCLLYSFSIAFASHYLRCFSRFFATLVLFRSSRKNVCIDIFIVVKVESIRSFSLLLPVLHLQKRFVVEYKLKYLDCL